jgi:surface protein
VDWGDGCVDQLREKGAGYVEHTYAAPGEYSVRIFPDNSCNSLIEEVRLDHLGFHDAVSAQGTQAWWRPLREIVSLGRCGIQSLSYLFVSSDELKVDLRNLSVGSIRSMRGMFKKSAFDQDIGDWDVRNVTDMSFMFERALGFNRSLERWDVSNVTDMSYMFSNTLAFNQPIGDWDVGNVTEMGYMFFRSLAFNQPIGDWNVSNVTDMSCVFNEASSFNQPLGKWDVSNVTDMSYMFDNAVAFNQPIGTWDVKNVTSMTEMFEGASAFKQDLSHWTQLRE